MPTLELDNSTTGTLAGGQFKTVPFDMAGEFREVQFKFIQSGASQDFEPHFLEFHFTIAGVSMESL